MSKSARHLCLLAALFTTAAAQPTLAQDTSRPVRVAIVGLVHGHVGGFLPALAKSNEAKLVAVVEPNQDLAHMYASRYHLDANLLYTDLDVMLKQQHPDAVLVYTTILDHRRVIEAAANYGVSSMVEKPLTTTMEDALAIQRSALQHHVHVLVNYETTWYPSNAEAIRAARGGELGTVRKVVVHDGHQGPKEIGVGPEWLPWLTDPKQDGAGALFDFGCYGADLMTVLRNGQPPTSVTAVVQTDKPDIYPHVDDDATVILRYPGTQAVLMPSWDWSFARKDMEVYGTKASLVTVAANDVLLRTEERTPAKQQPAPDLPADQSNSLSYLTAVLKGRIKDEGDLSALDTNMVVMQILTAARESAQTGRTVTLKPLPPQ